MNGFMSAMKSTLNDEFNVSVTENGAVGYRTTGKELLDLNFAVASLRKASPNDIANRFVRAFFEDMLKSDISGIQKSKTALCQMKKQGGYLRKSLIWLITVLELLKLQGL